MVQRLESPAFAHLIKLSFLVQSQVLNLSSLAHLIRLESLLVLLTFPESSIPGLDLKHFPALRKFRLVRHENRYSENGIASRAVIKPNNLWNSLEQLKCLRELDLSGLCRNSVIPDAEFVANVTNLTSLTSLSVCNTDSPRKVAFQVWPKLPNLRFLQADIEFFGHVTIDSIAYNESTESRQSLETIWNDFKPAKADQTWPMVYSRSKRFPSLLMATAERNSKWAAKYFLRNRLSTINDRHPINGSSPLSVACLRGASLSYIQLLASSGCDVNAETLDRRVRGAPHILTPLCYLAYNRYLAVEATKALIELGADATKSSIHPVEVAIYVGNYPLVEHYVSNFEQTRPIACQCYVDCVKTNSFRRSNKNKKKAMIWALLNADAAQLKQEFKQAGLQFRLHILTFRDTNLRKLYGLYED